MIVYPMPESIGGPAVLGVYALGISDQGTRMIHTEGVAYSVTADKPWCWTDYDPSQRTWTEEELIAYVTDGRVVGVDLADWVRTFGARLESNFCQVHAALA